MRRAIALGLVVALVALGGCTSLFGPGEPSDQALNKNATYDWDTNATSTFEVRKNQFEAVITVENKSWVKVWQKDELNNNEPLSVKALRYRYPNGTVIAPNGSEALDVSVGGAKTNLTLPQEGGQVAFTASRSKGKRFGTPLFLDGKHSVEMTLPPSARVGVPFLSKVSPATSDRSVENDRMTLRWEDRKQSVFVRYYLERDLLIFGGLLGVLVLVGVGGTVYYFREIKVTEKRRKDIAPDIDYEDDDIDDDDPPPGMG